MLKKMRLGFLLLVITLGLSACNKAIESSEAQQVENKGETSSSSNKEKGSTSKEKADVEKDETNSDDQSVPSASPVSIVIYYSNDDATSFSSERVDIESLSAEKVLEALILKGAIASDVQILRCETKTVDNKLSLELDLNMAFRTYVTNMGSTGEYFAIGSVCNTFLNAYNCEQIKITVEGQTLTTGYAEYPGYLTAFE